MNSFSASRFLFELTFFYGNSLSVSRNQFECSILSRIHFTLKIFIVNSEWINLLDHEFPFNSLSPSRIHYKYTRSTLQFHDEFTIIFAYSLSIYYLFREKLSIHYQFHYQFPINSLSVSWIHLESTIFYAKSLWIK